MGNTLVRLLIAGSLLAAGVVAGCGKKKPEPGPPKPPPLCVELKGHPRLNWFRGKAHTIYARVYPLTGVEAFTAAKVSALLADPPPFLPGLAGTPQSRSVHPDSAVTVNIDSASGQEVRSVGVVAGYYQPLGASKLVLSGRDLVLSAQEPQGDSCLVVELGEAGIASATGGEP